MRDLKGMIFGRLRVLYKSDSRIMGNDNRSRVYWMCECSCGNLIEVQSTVLVQGLTKSCGCIKKETIGLLNFKHGESKKTKENRIWNHMKGRCYCKTDAKYKNYGYRGIRVCDRWLKSYDDFLLDMGRCPPKYSIHRINNNGDYSPENCKWANDTEQANERTTNVFISYLGENMTMKQWSDRLGYKYKCFHYLYRYKNKTMEDLSYGRYSTSCSKNT